ncbi:hypothetical protein [Teredinibacter haidensis]|uniref:hypothetical protein n=1 Tax=Teredinibacter haidensis TaxID=2731755 RepID=UPI000948BE33|nr:hypothetical protein [Teredinibacter haidensis]
MKKLLIFLIGLVAVSGTSNLYAEVVKVSANKVIYDSYNAWTDKKNCSGIDNFRRTNIHRGVVELLLICKALNIGGLHADLQVKEVPNYSRALVEAKKGNVTMPAETVWKVEIDESAFYVSDPIFEEGSIELGVYALPTNLGIMKVDSLNDLKKYKSISSDRWVVDWETLNAMGVEKNSVPKLDVMFKFIGAGRADFVLSEFSSEEDFSMEMAGVRLVPVPNIKVGLKGTRHFVVSKKSPNAEKVFRALQKGLKKLHSEDVISRAFVESGIVNPRVKNWKRIYPEDLIAQP